MVRNLSKLFFLALLVTIGIGLVGCKSQKKLAKEKAAAEYAAKVEEAKKDLLAIINDETDHTLDEKESLVASIRNMNLDEPEIDALLKQADAKLAEERSELNRLEMEAKRLAEEEKLRTETASLTIHDYFHSIANASSVSEANMFINEAIKLFSSPDAPVLIIISQEGDIIDYDRPTTILNYLNYLKDTRNNINKVERAAYNEQGLIKELELIKNL